LKTVACTAKIGEQNPPKAKTLLQCFGNSRSLASFDALCLDDKKVHTPHSKQHNNNNYCSYWAYGFVRRVAHALMITHKWLSTGLRKNTFRRVRKKSLPPEREFPADKFPRLGADAPQTLRQ